MNTSIVIPLGTGSRWNDTELRYCLRSVEKHLTGYGDIFIIGEKPDWVRNVIHIPCAGYGDKTYDKERNIYTKVMAAIADKRVTDDFLFMNDDHFLLQNYEAGKFPFYCHGWLSEYMTVTDYKNTVKNTNELLRPLGHDCLYFDLHCPIIYNKEKFAWCVSDADWSTPFGYCIKTVYGNCVEGLKAIEYPDFKINEPLLASKIRQLIAGRAWFSIGDKAFDGGIRNVLQEHYPHKSKYE
jgi:hypothetical protein